MLIEINKSNVDAAEPGNKDEFYWDTKISGFGLKVTPAGRKVFIFQYRPRGASVTKRYTIGVQGAKWMPDEARRKAKKLLGAVADGRDPAEEEVRASSDKTVAELRDLFIAEGCVTFKPTASSTTKVAWNDT